mmetsp:Transcript_47325/g.143903  ORF Transcript_47325/g.143903 Transcript_47325/m.143903 type:complete len:238 (+) Transcript_47325:204-917(+)
MESASRLDLFVLRVRLAFGLLLLALAFQPARRIVVDAAGLPGQARSVREKAVLFLPLGCDVRDISELEIALWHWGIGEIHLAREDGPEPASLARPIDLILFSHHVLVEQWRRKRDHYPNAKHRERVVLEYERGVRQLVEAREKPILNPSLQAHGRRLAHPCLDLPQGFLVSGAIRDDHLGQVKVVLRGAPPDAGAHPPRRRRNRPPRASETGARASPQGEPGARGGKEPGAASPLLA